MALVIDCYNLLHATMPPALAGLDELGLCRLLARSGFAEQRITIVCDGKPKPHAPGGTQGSMALIYSGPHRSADDVIISLVEQDSSPRRLMVVSSDRAIQAAARRRRAVVFTAEQFVHLLAREAGTGGTKAAPTRPTQPLTNEQVERWLDEFGIDGDEPIEDRPWWE